MVSHDSARPSSSLHYNVGSGAEQPSGLVWERENIEPMTRDLVRDDVVLSAKTWVVKVGTSVLAAPDGTLDLERVGHLAEQICAVMAAGRRVALVSSGAVGAGIGRLGLSRRPESLAQVQACAAIGQSYLIRAYDEGFRRHGRNAAQLLLTHEDFDNRARYLNMRNTLSSVFTFGAVPVINENDTISVDEIRFGDNDRLAAMVANLLQAPLLVILSVANGLCRTDPGSGGHGEVIPLVPILDESTYQLAGSSKSALGSGGMQSKLQSARLVTQAGGSVIIASGKDRCPLTRILAGEGVGTLFLARGEALGARKRWIGSAARPKGTYVVDQGARAALESGTKSLLAIGLISVAGEFDRGDVISVQDADGNEFARGLTNFDTRDSRSISGLRTEKVREILGGSTYEELIHKDNLVLTR